MAPSKVVLVMKAEVKMAFKALLLVVGVAAVGAASKCSSKNGGEELTCQMRTLQSGLQACTYFSYQHLCRNHVVSLIFPFVITPQYDFLKKPFHPLLKLGILA